MPSSLSQSEAKELARLLRIVTEVDGGFIPDEAYIPVHRTVPWPAVEVCLVRDDGAILLEHRKFTEWPAENSKALGKPWNELEDLYVMGGYLLPNDTLDGACMRHLLKDGVKADFNFLGVAGCIKWMPGDHPYGTPVSLVCICLASLGQVRYQWYKDGTWEHFYNRKKFLWTREPRNTKVPHHKEVQEIAFKWIAAHPEYFKKK